MNFTYRDLKGTLYLLETLLGVVLIGAAIVFINATPLASHPLWYVFPGAILLMVGIACVFFGIETYFLRDDPDIWR